MDRPIPLRRLRAILARYGVAEDPSRGKGLTPISGYRIPNLTRITQATS